MDSTESWLRFPCRSFDRLEETPCSSSSRTRRKIAKPEENSSKHPRLPQLQRLPFSSTVVCPSSPAKPLRPTCKLPPKNIAEPIPLPTETSTKLLSPFAC